MPAPVLLTDAQVQDYLNHGYLVLHTCHPGSFHRSVLRQIATLYATKGNPGNDILPRVPDLYEILRDPVVDGALQSLLGADYLIHPHRHCHENPSGSDGQRMHQDSYENDENVRHHRTRWAMAFYYPQDVSLEMGPTAVLPASQYFTRRAGAPAGRVAAVRCRRHRGHRALRPVARAMPNARTAHRYMVKFLFTRMSSARRNLGPPCAAWNLAGDDPPAALRAGCGTGMRAAKGSRKP